MRDERTKSTVYVQMHIGGLNKEPMKEKLTCYINETSRTAKEKGQGDLGKTKSYLSIQAASFMHSGRE